MILNCVSGGGGGDINEPGWQLKRALVLLYVVGIPLQLKQSLDFDTRG